MSSASPSDVLRSDPGPSPGAPPRKVLLVENTIRGLGGSYESLFLTAKGLPRDRFEPVVLFFQSNHFATRLEALGIRVIVERSRRFWEKEDYIRKTERMRSVLPRRGFFGGLRRLTVAFARGILGGIPMAWTVYRILRREKIDLLHANNNIERDSMVILGGILAGVPIIVHERQLARCSGIAKALSSRVHTVICISDAVLEFTRGNGLRARRNVRIHNAIDLDALRSVRPELGAGPRRVGIAARIMPRKGQHHFIEAARRILDEVPGTEFYIIGRATEEDRAYEEELRGLARRLGIESSIRWTGYREEPLGLIASLDVAVHAAVEPEPFGRVIIEALALGVPVIATALGGPVEIIEDGVSGFLVPPGDAAALAEKTVALLRDPELSRRVSSAARRRVEEAFDLERYIGSIVEVYDEALVPRGGGSPAGGGDPGGENPATGAGSRAGSGAAGGGRPPERESIR